MNDEVKTRPTGRDLAERGIEALDVTGYQGMPVDNENKPGEIAGVDWMKVIELGKALSAMQDGVPPHVRGKWGIACRIAANAHQWKMDPFAVADQTYMVGGRLAYMSQIIHARINQGAPLMSRLKCEYRGEGAERQCTVTGTFMTGEERPYESPKVKDIKVKNSPLWANDLDQQLWYFSVRSWARKWVPEVILGLYTKEELQADKSLGYEDTAPGLHARLKGSEPSDEGHKAEHVAAELDRIENGGPEANEQAENPVVEGRPSRKTKSTVHRSKKDAKRTSDVPKAKTAKQEPDTETVSHETKVRGTVASAVAYPSTVAEYVAYARRWIKSEDSRLVIGERWASERRMRNAIGVTAEDRAPLEELIEKRVKS